MMAITIFMRRFPLCLSAQPVAARRFPGAIDRPAEPRLAGRPPRHADGSRALRRVKKRAKWRGMREMAGSRLRHAAWQRGAQGRDRPRSEEHTSELQSLMRNSYAVFRLKTKKLER